MARISASRPCTIMIIRGGRWPEASPVCKAVRRRIRWCVGDKMQARLSAAATARVNLRNHLLRELSTTTVRPCYQPGVRRVKRGFSPTYPGEWPRPQAKLHWRGRPGGDSTSNSRVQKEWRGIHGTEGRAHSRSRPVGAEESAPLEIGRLPSKVAGANWPHPPPPRCKTRNQRAGKPAVRVPPGSPTGAECLSSGSQSRGSLNPAG